MCFILLNLQRDVNVNSDIGPAERSKITSYWKKKKTRVEFETFLRPSWICAGDNDIEETATSNGGSLKRRTMRTRSSREVFMSCRG